MQYKTTKRLFNGTYQYKVVLICACSSAFRHKNSDDILKNIQKIRVDPANKDHYHSWRGIHVKSQKDLDYAFQLHALLAQMSDITIRVESPWVSVYTNDKSNIDALIALDRDQVKYVCIPPENTALVNNTIIMPKVNFDYRITLGKTTQEHSAFVQWAEANAKLKLTKSCKNELSKSMSWGGTFFYVTGDNNLLLAKMHLGSSINKIERIIKA